MECKETNCWARLDWDCEHAGLARVFREGAIDGVDEYCYALHYVVRERFEEPELSGKIGLIEFTGVIQPPTPCQYRAMFAAVAAEGWGVLSTRVKDGVSRTIELRQAYWDHCEYLARTGQGGMK